MNEKSVILWLGECTSLHAPEDSVCQEKGQRKLEYLHASK